MPLIPWESKAQGVTAPVQMTTPGGVVSQQNLLQKRVVNLRGQKIAGQGQRRCGHRQMLC